MRSAISTPSDPFAIAAAAAADELVGVPGLEDARERLQDLPRYVRRCGDVLADVLEETIGTVQRDRPTLAARLSTHLIDVILAEEGFSRRFWRTFRAHLRLLQAAGRHAEAASCLRETLQVAAAFG